MLISCFLNFYINAISYARLCCCAKNQHDCDVTPFPVHERITAVQVMCTAARARARVRLVTVWCEHEPHRTTGYYHHQQLWHAIIINPTSYSGMLSINRWYRQQLTVFLLRSSFVSASEVAVHLILEEELKFILNAPKWAVHVWCQD